MKLLVQDYWEKLSHLHTEYSNNVGSAGQTQSSLSLIRSLDFNTKMMALHK